METLRKGGDFRFSRHSRYFIYDKEPAIAAMHGPQSVFDIGHCTVVHCDAGGVSLVDLRKAEKN